MYIASPLLTVCLLMCVRLKGENSTFCSQMCSAEPLTVPPDG